MVRVAKPTDPKRIEELKQKIDDELYLKFAIQQIAQTLTKKILHIEED